MFLVTFFLCLPIAFLSVFRIWPISSTSSGMNYLMLVTVSVCVCVYFVLRVIADPGRASIASVGADRLLWGNWNPLAPKHASGTSVSKMHRDLDVIFRHGDRT